MCILYELPVLCAGVHCCAGFTKWLNFILAPTDTLGQAVPNTGRTGTGAHTLMWPQSTDMHLFRLYLFTVRVACLQSQDRLLHTFLLALWHTSLSLMRTMHK